MHHHTWLSFVYLVQTGFCHVGQVGLELLTSVDPLAVASQSAGNKNLYYSVTCLFCFFCYFLTFLNFSFYEFTINVLIVTSFQLVLVMIILIIFVSKGSSLTIHKFLPLEL